MRTLKSTFMAAFATLSFTVGGAYAQEAVVLKFAHEAPETAIKGRTAKFFAEKVDEYSDGSLKVEVFPGASLIPTKDEVRAVIRGQVDMIAPQTSYYVPFNPGWDVFYQPLLFNSAEEGMGMLAGDLGRDLLSELESIGLKGMGIWHDGPGYLFLKDEPVTDPDNLEGHRIRLFPSAPLEAGIRASGAVPVSMPAPDVYLSLQQGLIDGVVTAVTYAAPARWYEVLKAGTRMTMFVGGYGVVINQDRWNGLSDEHKDILQRAMKDAEQWNYDLAEQNIQDAEQTLTENGVELVDLSDEELAAWRELMAPVYEEQPAEVRKLIERVQSQR